MDLRSAVTQTEADALIALHSRGERSTLKDFAEALGIDSKKRPLKFLQDAANRGLVVLEGMIWRRV